MENVDASAECLTIGLEFKLKKMEVLVLEKGDQKFIIIENYINENVDTFYFPNLANEKTSLMIKVDLNQISNGYLISNMVNEIMSGLVYSDKISSDPRVNHIVISKQLMKEGQYEYKPEGFPYYELDSLPNMKKKSKESDLTIAENALDL